MNLTDYDYSPTKLNALVSVEDLNGIIANVEQDIVYNALHQPSSISEGNYELELEYGADGQRISSKLKETESLKRTRHYLPNFEKQVFTDNNKEQQIHYIAGGDGLAAIYVIEDGVGSMYYTYTDYLGSILKVTDNIGNLVAEQSFDAWGRKRNAANWTYSTIAAVPDWLYRGYTGHEHYEEFALINMNGRMYDPLLGRMLSVDNYVQDNTTQNYNRYTYALNNPLKYTDPSGEIIGFAVGAFLIRGMVSHFSGKSSSETFRSEGGTVLAGLAPLQYGIVIGAISGQNSKLGFYGGALAGMGISVLGSNLSKLGGGSFVENVVWGSTQGAILGGVSAAIFGNNVEDGIRSGFIMGGLYAAGYSLYQSLNNYSDYKMFGTNDGVFNRMVSNSKSGGSIDANKAQLALDFWHNRFGGPNMDYSDETVTSNITGEVTIGTAKFKAGYKHVRRAIAHEHGHYFDDIVWKDGVVGGEPLGKWHDNSFSYGRDGLLGYHYAIRNAGKYRISRNALIDRANSSCGYCNEAWNEYDKSILYKHNYLFPKR